MKIIVASLALSLTLIACSSKDAIESTGNFGVASAPASRQQDKEKQPYLAYEHTIVVDLEESELKPIYEKLLATCSGDKALDCAVLDASFTSDRYLSARLRLRAKPEGIKKLAAVASAGGRVSSQSTHVEDLAKPITDVARRLAMSQDYQKKLLELQQRKNNDIDSLIKIAEKLAAVQSDLEKASGENAYLMARVNLEILNVSLSTRSLRSFWSPIGDALRDFPANLSSGVSTAILAVAYVLPWLFIVLVMILIIRIAWRIFRRR